MKKNKGITLIALIITIIILLILAAVSLNFVLGDNGIIFKVQLAKEKTNISQNKETEELGVLENTINEMSLSRKSSGSSTILYPGGTQNEPAILNSNQRI